MAIAHSVECRCSRCTFEETRKAYEDSTVKTAAELVKAAGRAGLPAPLAAAAPAALANRDGFANVTGGAIAAENVAITKRKGVAASPHSDEPLRGIEAWLPPKRAARKHPRMLLVDRLGFERIEEGHGGHSHIVAAHGGLNGQHIEVTFEWYGRTERNGEELIEFREVSECAHPQWRLEPEFPSVEALARAIFNTDREVRSFITDVADNVVPLTETRWSTALGRSETVAIRGQDVAEIRKWDPKLLQRAWDHDEHGWRTRAMLRAKNVIASLKGTLP